MATTRLILIENMTEAKVYDVPYDLISEAERVLMREGAGDILDDGQGRRDDERKLHEFIDSLCSLYTLEEYRVKAEIKLNGVPSPTPKDEYTIVFES